jgi:hypothetical protein
MKKTVFNVLFLIILFPVFALAQGAATDPASSSGVAPAPVSTNSTGTPAPSAVSTTPILPRAIPKIKPKAVAPKPVLKILAPSTTPITPPETSGAEQNIIVATLVAFGASVLAFLGFNAQSKKINNKNDPRKCANIKKLMEDKLNELTDLKGQLADRTKDLAIEQIKDITAGTPAGKLLVFIENREQEYEKLKELYEKCITDLDLERANYTGVIIEESLIDKKILDEVKILKKEVEPVVEKHKTPWVKQWTKHSVEVPEKDADKVAKQLSEDLDKEHPWYADFKNEKYHFIIYRGKVFKVDLKNPTLYKDAQAYGISLGIPEYQVNWV